MKNSIEKKKNLLTKMLRKRILWILFGLALLGVLLLVAMPFGIEYGFKRYLLSQGVDQTIVEDVDFNPFTRRLVVKNLIGEAGAAQVLKVGEAGFTLAWSPFFKKRFVLEKVDLNESAVTIEELPDGRWRIGGLAPTSATDQSTPSSWGFGLGELQIQNSQVSIRSSQLTTDLKIEEARLTRLRSWLPDQNARLELKGQLNDGKLQFQGDFAVFGSVTLVDGSLKLQGLSLTPFAQLMTADPNTLQGRLDSDVRVQTKYNSEKGLDFDQRGRLTLKQARLRFGDVELADEDFTWDGSIQVKLPAASDIFQITVAGKLEGKSGFVNPTPDKLAFQHKGLGWNGKFILDRKTQTADYTFDGALALEGFKMATGAMNVAEESLRWEGNVGIKIPNSAGGPRIAAEGELAGKGASLETPSTDLKLQGKDLNWNGEFAFTAETEAADVKLDGDLSFAKLEIATADTLIVEEGLKWRGDLQMALPENAAAQRLTSNGSLESGSQRIALLPQKLDLANKNLSWKGRFVCGLKEFTAGLGAEGDFSLTDLAVTAAPKKLMLLASKTVNLKSITGDADTQFKVATASITGLDLIRQTSASNKDSLLSAAEVQIDTVKIERLKKVSIQTARMVDAKGILHRKNDGRWLYIDELKTFLADSGVSAPKKPTRKAGAEKTQPRAKEENVESGIRIGSLEITGDSAVHFEDETVSPAFSTEVRLKEARLAEINSYQPQQSSPIMLEAESRKYTRIKVQGKIQPFTERISMDLNGKIKAVEMPPLSPYAVKTIGYNLKSGEMDADIDLKISAGKLEGEGDLKFYKPIVEAVNPEKLESGQGKPIPLQSALKVLRDKDDDVRLKIPISGDVSDPKFSFANALNQALIKGLSLATLSYLKYMLGPYGTAIGVVELGVKVGSKVLSGIRLNPIEFQPGTSELNAATFEYVDKVAAILKEKEDLRLRLCGWSTEADRQGQTEQEMLSLAEQRADRIEDILVGQHGIKDKRIFICQPQIDASPDAKPRVELVF